MGNKIRHVFTFQMKLAYTNQRIRLIFILAAIFVFSNLQGVLEFSQDVGIPVAPWAFPHITSDYICQLVIMAGQPHCSAMPPSRVIFKNIFCPGRAILHGLPDSACISLRYHFSISLRCSCLALSPFFPT